MEEVTIHGVTSSDHSAAKKLVLVILYSDMITP